MRGIITTAIAPTAASSGETGPPMYLRASAVNGAPRMSLSSPVSGALYARVTHMLNSSVPRAATASGGMSTSNAPGASLVVV